MKWQELLKLLKKLNNAKFYKGLTIAISIIVLLSLAVWGARVTVASPRFCSSCHEMAPEYHTWKFSRHSKISCADCHHNPNIYRMAYSSVSKKFKEKRYKSEDFYTPIRLKEAIPDETCEKCHKKSKGNVSAFNDVVIPHEIHKENQVKCFDCHSKNAHGDVANRQIGVSGGVTAKWDDELGKEMMADERYSKSTMATCMDCHRAREIKTSCDTCHTTGMIPDTHLDKKFKNRKHGQLAKKNVEACNDCHKYTSKAKIDMFNTDETFANFLNGDTELDNKELTEKYAKTSSFCGGCHAKRPPSHGEKGGTYGATHGQQASKSTEKCMVCHDNKKITGQPAITRVQCSSCHPSTHHFDTLKSSHPIIKQSLKKIVPSCFRCHSKTTCVKCHITIQ